MTVADRTVLPASHDRNSATMLSGEENYLVCCSDRLGCDLSTGSRHSTGGHRDGSDLQVKEGPAFEMMVLSFPPLSPFAVAIGLASRGPTLVEDKAIYSWVCGIW